MEIKRPPDFGLSRWKAAVGEGKGGVGVGYLFSLGCSMLSLDRPLHIQAMMLGAARSESGVQTETSQSASGPFKAMPVCSAYRYTQWFFTSLGF